MLYEYLNDLITANYTLHTMSLSDDDKEEGSDTENASASPEEAATETITANAEEKTP